MHEIRELTITSLSDNRFVATVKTFAGDEIAIVGEYKADGETVTLVGEYDCVDRYRDELGRLDRLPVEPLYWLIEQRLKDALASRHAPTPA